MAWGEAKQRLFAILDSELAPAREQYQTLVAKPGELEDILQAGAAKARRLATPFLGELREAVGLRSFRTELKAGSSRKKTGKAARFASFREQDGSFRFRFFTAEGEELLLSRSFQDPKAAGTVTRRLVDNGAASLELRPAEDGRFTLWLDGECIADSPGFADAHALDAAMQRLREALATLAE